MRSDADSIQFPKASSASRSRQNGEEKSKPGEHEVSWNPVECSGRMKPTSVLVLLATVPLAQGLQTMTASQPRAATLPTSAATTGSVPEALVLPDRSHLATTLEDKLIGQVQAALGPHRHTKPRGASTVEFLHAYALQRRSQAHGHHFAFYRGISSYPGAPF